MTILILYINAFIFLLLAGIAGWDWWKEDVEEAILPASLSLLFATVNIVGIVVG